MTTPSTADDAPMTDFVSCLREEIIASQNARLDFIKWKMLLIAALGAVGLGLAGEKMIAAPAVLGFIPIACAYVNVVCAHANFRILLIGYFLRTGGSANRPPDTAAADYEALCEANRGGFALESIVLWGTTIAMSALVAFAALASPSLARLHLGPAFENMPPGITRFLWMSAIVGSLVSIVATRYKDYRVGKLASPPAPPASPSHSVGARHGA